MRRVAASLAAVICALAAGGCGDGAEPGAPEGATLMLDFTPNAVHTGIYVAQHRGYFEDEGIDLTIREPSESSDAPKLLEAGRVDFAILDINDYGIARERGLRLEPLAAIVNRPLGAVIAQEAIRRPRQLEGRTVGVTGLPSDDAVLDTVVRSDGGNPSRVERTNIGFNAIAALAAGRIDAATAFWNAEGVALRQQGIPTREFRVDENGAPKFPELLVVALRTHTESLSEETLDGILSAMRRGYRDVRADPSEALSDLLAEVPALDRDQTEAELHALQFAFPHSGLLTGHRLSIAIGAWGGWALQNGLVRDLPFPIVTESGPGPG
jgi:putative hydroxymethylpyrimidine transport system substrate-binding protein